MSNSKSSVGTKPGASRIAHKLHHLPAIYFLHIPKTAGTSFRLWLEELFSTDGRLPVDHLSELEEFGSSGLPEAQFYSGHFGWRLMEMAQAAHKQVAAITLLREPSAHYRSGYTFFSEISGDEAGALGPNRQRDIEVVNARFRAQHPSPAVPAAAPVAPPDLPKPGPITAVYMNMTIKNIAHYGTQVEVPIIVGTEEFDRALKRLNDMPFFGLVADWPRSAVLFADAFYLPLRQMTKAENLQGPQSKAIVLPPAFGDLSPYYNRYDVALYEQAKLLFDNRYAEVAAKFGLNVDSEAEAFRVALKRQFIDAGKRLPKQSRLAHAVVPVQAAMIKDNFPYRYYVAESDCWQIWSGPELDSAIYLPIDRSRPRILSLHVQHMLTDSIRDGLRFTIDGEPAQSSITESGPEGVVMQIGIPATGSASEPGYTEVGFHVPETIKVEHEAFPLEISFALSGNLEVKPDPAYRPKGLAKKLSSLFANVGGSAKP